MDRVKSAIVTSTSHGEKSRYFQTKILEKISKQQKILRKKSLPLHTMSSHAATPSAASAGYALIAPTTAIAATVHILAVRSGEVHRLRSRLQVAASSAEASSGQLRR